MKKRLVFLPVAALLAAGSAVCRLWQRDTAFEASGLLTPGEPASRCLLGVVLLAGVAFFLLGRWMGKGAGVNSYLSAFALPGWGTGLLLVLSAAALAAAGGQTLWTWGMSYDAPVIQLLSGLGFLLSALCVLLVAWLGGRKTEGSGRFFWPLLVPGYCGCVWLIMTYQARAAEPNVMGYAPCLLGGVCAAVFCCVVASFSFEKPMVTAAVWWGGMGLVLLAAALVDSVITRSPADALAQGGYFLYLAAQLKCLVTRCERPAPLERWTPPAEDEEVENEVTDHE